MGCGAFESTNEPTLHYEDIYGTWLSTSSYYPFTFNEQLKPATYRAKSYYVFSCNSSQLYEEEWSEFSYTALTWKYFSTTFYAGKSLLITETGEHSTDEGKEVFSIDWVRYTRASASNEWTPVYSYSYLMSYVLLYMSENTDTLVIGYCDSYDCGGDQFMDRGHNGSDTLIRVPDQTFEDLQNSWWYY